MATKSVDAGYHNFVRLLQEKNDILSVVELLRLGGAVVHYLSTLPLDHISSFSNTIAMSPSIWGDFPNKTARCDTLQTAFHSAVLSRFEEMRKSDPEDVALSRAKKDLNKWARLALDGIIAQQPDPELRLALLTGLLQGLADHKDLTTEDLRRAVEAEIAVACAELLETFFPSREQAGGFNWAHEYRKRNEESFNPKLLMLRRVGPGLLLLSIEKLQLLDLKSILDSSFGEIVGLYSGGHFLDKVPSELRRQHGQLIDVEVFKDFTASIDKIDKDPRSEMLSMLSKLVARCIVGLESTHATRRISWITMADITTRLDDLTRSCEVDWAKSPLSSITDEKEFSRSSIPIMTSLWRILKSFLFSNILIAQSILRTATFESVPKSFTLASETSPQTLSSTIISSFFHLSFITSRFGGGLTSQGGGFSEQKRTFYTALDILSSNPWEAELLIKRLAGRLSGLDLVLGHPVREARTSFFLACCEQLMPTFNDPLIEHTILPTARYHLNRPQQRETYEAAHSVVLSIFSAHAARAKHLPRGVAAQSIAVKLTPFYVQCLLENCEAGRLSSGQLCLAYSSVVTHASMVDYALTEYCINQLIKRLPSGGLSIRQALISLISTVDAEPLPSLLARVEQMVEETIGERDLLIIRNEISKQILEKVGDAEREIAMRWWFGMKEAIDVRLEEQQDDVSLSL